MLRQLAVLALFLCLLTACGGEEASTPSTEAPTPAVPTTPPHVTQMEHSHSLLGLGLELPVQGATGYTGSLLNLRDAPDGNKIGQVPAGTCFRIMQEVDAWWEILTETGERGYLASAYCLINLPDVIPSIVYDNTNTYASRFLSSGQSIPNLSQLPLYDAQSHNVRLGKEQYIMPVLYPMAKKLYFAQDAALLQGDSIKIYEAYRPYETQVRVIEALGALANSNPTVKDGISTAPWSVPWFINTGVSNHQKGFAVDISLVRILEAEDAYIGEHTYHDILDYEEYTMPSPFHELSIASAIFTAPVNSSDRNAWRNSSWSEGMANCPPAQKLQNYCTSAGLTPLASEWWHFNDWDSAPTATGKGTFIPNRCMSIPPA